MAKVLFSRGLSTVYTGLAEKQADTIYFLTDTQQIYLGEQLIADTTKLNVQFVDAVPELDTAKEDVLYVVTGADGGMYIKGDSAMDQVSGGEAESVKDGVLNLGNFQAGVVATEIGESPTDTTIPTSQAVKEYVDSVRTSITQQLTTLEGEIDTAFDNVEIVAGGEDHPNQFGLQFSRIGNENPVTIYLDKEQYLLDADVAEREVGDPPEAKQCLVLTVQIINPEGGAPSSKEVAIPIEDVVQVNASTVNTTQQIFVTTPVGNYNVGDTIDPTDIQTILTNMLCSPEDPEITAQPSITLTVSPTSIEIGSTLTPKYTVTSNPGAYKYKSTAQKDPITPVDGTGVTFSGWSIKQDGSEVGTTEGSNQSGTEVMIEASGITFTADANYSDGNYALTNVNTLPAEDVRISAGAAAQQTKKITSYRAYFYGYKNGTNAIADVITGIDSAMIRNLGPKAPNKPSSTLTTNQMKQIFYAFPAGTYTSVSVVNSKNGAPAGTVIKKTDVMVEGADGYEAVAYDVFYINNAAAESGSSTWTVTIS